MNIRLQPSPSRSFSEQSLQTATVWDLPLRVFHWGMVSVVVLAGITGFLAPEWWLDLHIIAGYALGALLAFRLAWGFVGSPYSRFNSFPLAFTRLRAHLRSILHGNPHVTIGHNPAGAWMIVILLCTLTTLVLSGLIVLGGQENLGPLAAVTSFQTGTGVKEIHETAAGILVGAVAIHLLGVFVETRIFRHPVLAAMLIGRKRQLDLHDGTTGKPYAVRGSILFMMITASLVIAGMSLATMPSPAWRAVAVPEVYSNECGDCHHAYHPSLRSRAAWQSIMNGLADHYGEDASLDEETTTIIRTYLDENNAGTFDTEVSQRVGRIDSPSFRMTDTAYWKKRHEDIDSSVFRLKAVGSKVNCNNCHKDAASGRFDDANIHVPTGNQT